MKRRLTKLVVFLLLGEIANVTVAWGMRLWSELHRQGSTVVTGDEVPDERLSEIPLTVRSKQWYARISLAGTGIEETWFVLTNAAGEILYAHPRMSLFPTHPHNLVSASMLERRRKGLWYQYDLVEVRIGWPARTFGGRYYSTKSTTVQNTEGFIHLPDSLIQFTRGKSRFELPIKPIWSGFAINTIFYAAILWLLSLGPSATRHLIRRKRGRCIKCGYDLRGDFSGGGSECGWRREDVP